MDLDGEWRVERLSGLLRPLPGVRKRIADGRGATALGPLPLLPFDVAGRELRYRGLLRGLVDRLEPAGNEALGVATYRGRPLGRFRMRRIRPRGRGPGLRPGPGRASRPRP